MSPTCRCSTHTEPSAPMAGATAEQTVAEVSKRPGALEVFQRLGVNHCCGAHFSLREAAAAAGVSLDELLRALDDPVAAPSTANRPSAAGADLTLDVRGLEPPLPMIRVLARLDALDEGTQLEVIHDRRPMFLYPQLDERGFAHETDEPESGVVRIRIRKRPRTAR